MAATILTSGDPLIAAHRSAMGGWPLIGVGPLAVPYGHIAARPLIRLGQVGPEKWVSQSPAGNEYDEGI